MNRRFTISIDKLLLWVSVGILFLYSFTSDLTNRIFPWTKYSVPALFIVSIFVLLNQVKMRIKCSLVNLLIVMMFIVVCLNNANIQHGSWYQFQFTLAFFLFFIIANQFERWHDIAFKLILLAGVFYCIMTFYCMFNPSFFKGTVIPLFEGRGYAAQMLQLYQEGYQTGFTAHYSANALYLSCGISVFVAYWLSGTKKQKKWGLFGTICLLVAIFVTGKRAHAVFAILAILVTYYFIHAYEQKRRWIKIMLLIASGVTIFIVAADFFPPLMNFINRFIETAEEGNLQMGRDVLRAFAVLKFIEYPILGIGWDSFKYLYLDATGEWLNVHCVYVQLLCETGIIGAIWFYLFFGICLYQAIKTVTYLAKYSECIEAKCRITFALFFQIFFLLYCITGNPLYDAATLLMYLVSCSISNYYYGRMRSGLL